jgi:hypothetical protein
MLNLSDIWCYSSDAVSALLTAFTYTVRIKAIQSTSVPLIFAAEKLALLHRIRKVPDLSLCPEIS